MAARFEKTRHPGIYRRGSSYVVTYRVGGKQKKESCRTLEEARKKKAARQAAIDAGEFQERTKLMFSEFAREWVERYQGRGRGFRESTRDDYRRLLNTYAIPYFDGQLRRRLTQVTPRDLANFVGWLMDPAAQAAHARQLALDEARRRRAAGERVPDPDRNVRRAREGLERLALKPGEEWTDVDRDRRARWLADLERSQAKRLSDSTIRNCLNPIRALYATAVAEGLVRYNPTTRVALPDRPSVDDDDHDEERRPFSREQLRTILELAPARHRLLLRLLAGTGLRISEAVGLEWRHLQLDGSHPHVKIRRAISRGRLGPPKSRHGRRDVPLSRALVDALRAHRKETEWPDDDHPVFVSLAGTALEPNNLRRRMLTPLVQEVDAGWASFHTFRHTYTSLLIARSENIVRISRLLGHHSAAFTLSTYAHLIPDDECEALDLGAELGEVRTEWEQDPPEPHRNGGPSIPLDPASRDGFASPTDLERDAA